VGNLAEGLIFKAFQASRPGSPQSYPQFSGMTFKALQNQRLRLDSQNLRNQPTLQPRQNDWKKCEHPPLD
jgi:hypothetical protein